MQSHLIQKMQTKHFLQLSDIGSLLMRVCNIFSGLEEPTNFMDMCFDIYIC